MLIIDDNLIKLAKMQEKLLKMSSNNREINLEQYKETITKIDKQAFDSLLDELDKINIHNQTLEEELEFLETVKNYYNQLNELQLSFINVLEKYNSNTTILSNLELIDIEYINTRMDTISGYLINKKNLETNKKRLEQLSDNLVEEEKKSKYLEEKLYEYEEKLRENFQNAEGRTIEDGKLQYISVQSEYLNLNYDFKKLLENKQEVEQELSKVEQEQKEMMEKLKTAEICYNSSPNSTSRQILNDIEKEFLKVRYHLTMLKILQYLVNSNTDYDLFIEKRENLLDLIKYRVFCLNKLGIHISIDPFQRTKINEQLENVSGLKDNAKTISKIKKEIVNLNEQIEEITKKIEDYKINLSNVKSKLYSEYSSNEDLLNVLPQEDTFKFDDFLEIKTVLDNQVVKVKDISPNFNIRIVRDKTNSVIKRVNEMITLECQQVPIPKTISTPELVIEKSSVDYQLKEESEINDNEERLIQDKIENPNLELVKKETSNVQEIELNEETIDKEKELVIDFDLFKTLDPFENISLFQDKIDDITEKEILLQDELDNDIETTIGNLSIELDENVSKPLPDLNTKLETVSEEMPDAFWITDEDNKKETQVVEKEPSFDEQIQALISDDNNKSLVKKLSA